MTEPSHASSLATAIDLVEERMALTKLTQQTQQDGAVNPTEALLEVTVSAESSASPAQILAAARDLSAHRAQIWPNVEAKRLDVHERGDTWAEVTEGTMVLKATFAKAVNHLGSRRLFGWFLRSALAAIEKTANTEPPINPQTATP